MIKIEKYIDQKLNFTHFNVVTTISADVAPPNE